MTPDMEKDMAERDLKRVIERIFSQMLDQTKRDSFEIIKILEQNKETLVKAPYKLNIEVLFKLKNCLLAAGFESRVVDVFIYYPLIENHIANLIEKKEGIVGCVDKARHIIKNYISYKQGDMTFYNNENFDPPLGLTLEQWFDFIDALIDFIYGKGEGFVKFIYFLKMRDGNELG